MAAGFVFADATLSDMLDAWHDRIVAGSAFTIHLFTNDRTPVDGDDAGDYTQASFAGYAAITLTMANWGAVSVTDFIASMVYAPNPEFSYTAGAGGAVTVYGYYLLDNASNFVMAERVVTEKSISPGDKIQVTPRIQQKTCRD